MCKWKWLDNWITKHLIISTIESITVHPGQIIVIYIQGVRTASQRDFILDALKTSALKDLNYIVCNIENIPKIDVIEREDVRPDQTIRQHYFIQL